MIKLAKCINDHPYNGYLTLNKIYILNYNNNVKDWYFYADNGIRFWAMRDRFEIINNNITKVLFGE